MLFVASCLSCFVRKCLRGALVISAVFAVRCALFVVCCLCDVCCLLVDVCCLMYVD